MSKQTFLNLENAKILLHQLKEFYQNLSEEWGKVSTQWNNLKSTWSDEQFDKFEPKFEQLVSHYHHEIEQGEKNILFLSQQIVIAEQTQAKISNIFNNLGGGIPVNQALPNLVSVENKIQKSSNNSQQKTSLDLSSVTPFAKNLTYKMGYGSFESFEIKSQIKIEAVLEDGTDIGYINIKKEGDRRIYIQDINVANDYRKKGIATMLVYNVQQKLPPGTELYFTTNDAPKFWQQMGFKPVNKDEKTEYCKTL